MNRKLFLNQILYSILLFGFLFCMVYIKSNQSALGVAWSYWIQYLFPLILGILLGSNWLLDLADIKGYKIRWHQLIIVTIPTAILYFMPFIYFCWKIAIITNPGILGVLLQSDFTQLSGIILGYSLISSIKVVKNAM